MTHSSFITHHSSFKKSVLIVEDDAILAVHLRNMLADLGFDVPEPVATGDDAIAAVAADRPDLVLMDIHLAGVMDGITAAGQIRSIADVPIVFLTSYSQDPLLQRAKMTAPYGYLLKPVSLRELAATIEMALYRHTLDQQLRQSEDRCKSLYRLLRLMCDNVPDLIWAKDMENRFLFVNRAMGEELLNVRDTDEPVGKTHLYFAAREKSAHPEEPNWYTFDDICVNSDALTLSTEGAQRFDEFGYVKGRFLFLDVYKAPFRDEKGTMIGTVGCGRDVTREKQLEEERKRAVEKRLELERQVQQAQKRESLLTMAGAIAHLFNNQLHAVLGNLEMARDDLPPDSRAAAILLGAEKGARKATELSHLMLTYVGQGVRHKEPLNLPRFIRGMLPSIRSAMPENIRLELDLSPAVPSLPMDSGDARQVVLNLLANAAEAVGKEEGEVRIAVRPADGDETFTGVNPTGVLPGKGPWVCLEVTDNGAGMDPETQSRMFDPFFTTRFVGRGLGLAVILGIVRVYDGTILVESEPHRGTTIRVLLPVGKPV